MITFTWLTQPIEKSTLSVNEDGPFTAMFSLPVIKKSYIYIEFFKQKKLRAFDNLIV